MIYSKTLTLVTVALAFAAPAYAHKDIRSVGTKAPCVMTLKDGVKTGALAGTSASHNGIQNPQKKPVMNEEMSEIYADRLALKSELKTGSITKDEYKSRMAELDRRMREILGNSIDQKPGYRAPLNHINPNFKKG